MPFDDKPKEKTARRGLKVDNSKSTILVPENNKIAFEQKADETIDRLQEYKQRSIDLGSKFKSFVMDSVLEQNKSPLVKDLEKETINKLIALANELNSDETQPEGTGGVALAQLLMKMMLVQRDKNNILSLKISQLESKISILEKTNLSKKE